MADDHALPGDVSAASFRVLLPAPIDSTEAQLKAGKIYRTGVISGKRS